MVGCTSRAEARRAASAASQAIAGCRPGTSSCAACWRFPSSRWSKSRAPASERCTSAWSPSRPPPSPARPRGNPRRRCARELSDLPRLSRCALASRDARGALPCARPQRQGRAAAGLPRQDGRRDLAQLLDGSADAIEQRAAQLLHRAHASPSSRPRPLRRSRARRPDERGDARARPRARLRARRRTRGADADPERRERTRVRDRRRPDRLRARPDARDRQRSGHG